MLTKNEQIEIIDSELKTLYAQRYKLELQGKAFKRVEHEDGINRVANLLSKVEGQIEFYESEKKSIQNGEEKGK